MTTGRRLPLSVLGVALITTALGGQPPPDYEGACSDAGCHDQYGQRTNLHDPVEEGLCDSCHRPSTIAVHKFEFTEKGAALCTQCHDEHEGRIKHAPVADGECIACHDPHASNAQGLLKGQTVGAVCEDCHDKTSAHLTFLHGPTAVGACTTCHDPHA